MNSGRRRPTHCRWYYGWLDGVNVGYCKEQGAVHLVATKDGYECASTFACAIHRREITEQFRARPKVQKCEIEEVELT